MLPSDGTPNAESSLESPRGTITEQVEQLPTSDIAWRLTTPYCKSVGVNLYLSESSRAIKHWTRHHIDEPFGNKVRMTCQYHSNT